MRSTTTIFGRDRDFKDGAISGLLLMMMLGVAEIVPRGRDENEATAAMGHGHGAAADR